MGSDEISRYSFELDPNLRKRLVRIIGRAMINGQEINYKNILLGILKASTDDQLLKAGIEEYEREQTLKNKKKEKKEIEIKQNKKKQG